MRRHFLHVAYPVSVHWTDTEDSMLGGVLEVVTVVYDWDNFWCEDEKSVRIDVVDTFGFGSVAGDTSFRATCGAYVDYGPDRAWKVTG